MGNETMIIGENMTMGLKWFLNFCLEIIFMNNVNNSIQKILSRNEFPSPPPPQPPIFYSPSPLPLSFDFIKFNKLIQKKIFPYWFPPPPPPNAQLLYINIIIYLFCGKLRCFENKYLLKKTSLSSMILGCFKKAN